MFQPLPHGVYAEGIILCLSRRFAENSKEIFDGGNQKKKFFFIGIGNEDTRFF